MTLWPTKIDFSMAPRPPNRSTIILQIEELVQVSKMIFKIYLFFHKTVCIYRC